MTAAKPFYKKTNESPTSFSNPKAKPVAAIEEAKEEKAVTAVQNHPPNNQGFSSPWKESLAILFAKLREVNKLQSLKPFTYPKPEDRGNFCAYHVTMGHTTNRCQALYKAIKELIDKKQIKEPVWRPPSQSAELWTIRHRVIHLSSDR